MFRFRVRGPLAALAACAAVPAALADKAKPAPPPPPAPRVAPLSPEAMVEAVQAERDAYSRRLEVCTQLRRVAADTNDSKLEAEALQLEQMAETTLKQRMAKLGVKMDARPPAPPLETIDRALGSGAAVTPLTAPKGGVPAGPATAKSSHFKVVNP